MNEDFYNSIPPQIRSNPTLLSGYLIRKQIEQMQNLPNTQIPFSTTMDYADTLGLVGDGNMPNQNVVQQTTGAEIIPTGTTTVKTDEVSTEGMTPEQAAMYAAIAGTPVLGTAAPSIKATQTAVTGLDNGNNNNNNNTNNTTTNGNFQFFNPYMGVDIPTASYMFGQSIGEGNTGMAIATGLKTGLGLGRNILSGLGHARRNKKLMDEYYDNQRKTTTQENNPTYYQDGGQQAPQQTASPEEQQMQQLFEGIAGALSQGVSPEEILQELVGMGIQEQEAAQMIEFVMQQLTNQQQVGSQQQAPPQQVPQEQPMMRDGGMYLERLKGKKIKNYTYNETTGNYEIEIE